MTDFVWLGYRVGRVRVIFALPKREVSDLFSADKVGTVPSHLAYIEWFTPFRQPEAHHGMYRISLDIRSNVREASIIPLSQIRRSIHLFPHFGLQVPREWSSANVLDKSSKFYVNSFTDRHVYGTVI